MHRALRSPRTHALARRAAGVVCAAVALGAAGPARAADPFDATQTQAAAEVAKSYWHATPCAGEVAVSWSAMAPSTNATSTWANPVDAYSAPEQNSQCSILFNSALTWDWTRFCSILVHEYGHLTGHPHAADPGDVMYAFYVKPVAECQAAPAQPATAPDLTASAAGLPTVVAVPAHSKAKKVKRALLVVVREPRKLRRHRMHR